MSKKDGAPGDTDLDLPKALVKRLVKSKLALADDGRDVQLNKDALLAFSESAKVFICHLSSTANEICRETKRSTISAEDVFQALEDIEFSEFVAPLRELLEAYRRGTREKKGRKVEQQSARKRKERASGAPAGPSRPYAAAHGGGGGGGEPLGYGGGLDLDAAQADDEQGEEAEEDGSDDGGEDGGGYGGRGEEDDPAGGGGPGLALGYGHAGGMQGGDVNMTGQ